MKLQNVGNSATPGPQRVSTTQIWEDGSSSATKTQPCSSTVEGISTSLARPRPKPRPTGKGKTKATEASAIDESQITSNESTTIPTPPRSMPRPRPITRAKRKSATVERTSTPLENVPESGISTSDDMQDTPRRGSKRGNITQLDEAPVPKKRKTRAQRSSTVEPAIGSTSMSLPVVIDAGEAIQDEHDPTPTTKRILRKRKTAVEHADGVPVKRLRGKTRK